MQIEVYYDAGDEVWAVFAWGHVDKAEFLTEAKAQQPDAVDAVTMMNDVQSTGELEVTHTYIRYLSEGRDEEYPFHWCKADDECAEAVTAISPD